MRAGRNSSRLGMKTREEGSDQEVRSNGGSGDTVLKESPSQEMSGKDGERILAQWRGCSVTEDGDWARKDESTILPHTRHEMPAWRMHTRTNGLRAQHICNHRHNE